MPYWWGLISQKKLSMAATARVIWPCWCQIVGWCLSVSLAVIVWKKLPLLSIVSNVCQFPEKKDDPPLRGGWKLNDPPLIKGSKTGDPSQLSASPPPPPPNMFCAVPKPCFYFSRELQKSAFFTGSLDGTSIFDERSHPLKSFLAK